MPKERIFNVELRGFILQHAIRQEALTSDILRIIFRILKDKTKTLGNTSSSLSFKNKIDLLRDLGDITDEENKKFIKLMEIRNQFAHNPKCISFVSLKKENSEHTNFLIKNYPNSEGDEESKILTSYISLFKECHKILIKIKKSYNRGFLIDLERYQSYEVLNNKFWDWTNQAREDFEKSWNCYNLNSNEILEPLKLTFFIATLDAFKYKLFSEISYETSEGERLEEIFKKKMSESEWEKRNLMENLNKDEEKME